MRGCASRRILREPNALGQAGVALRNEPGDKETLADLRAMYEPYINVLSDYLLMPLPGWLPKPRAIDNWQTSAWEVTAPAPEEPFRKCMRQDARRKSNFAAAE